MIQSARKRNEYAAFCEMVDAAGKCGPATKKWTPPLLSDCYRHICPAVPLDYLDENRSEYDITLRIARFELATGCFENIITNLPEHEFDFEDFIELYHLRWNNFSSAIISKVDIDSRGTKYEYQANFAEAFKSAGISLESMTAKRKWMWRA